MKTKTQTHTPGPWNYIERDLRNEIGVGFGAEYICLGPAGFGTHEANARLIAAGPELLAAARRALGLFDDLKIPSVKTRAGFSANVTRAALTAAVRKAEGK